MKCKLTSIVLLYSLMSVFGYAAAGEMSGKALDKVIFQLTEEQWVITETAKVVVSIDASLDEEDLAAARNQIVDNLKQIASADWHITQFSRSQDSSGLQRLYVIAEARVEEALLREIYSKVDAVSAPGATYRINNIDFTPSLIEIEQVRQSVRQQVYAQINNEIARLAQDFPNQSFQLHKVNFGVDLQPLPGVDKRAGTVMSLAEQAAPVSVSNKVQIVATVVLAASHKEDAA